MALVVMKFGGTSVATAESRRSAIAHVKAEREAGNRVVVVVSAMGREGEPYATDTLLSLLQGEDPLVKDQLISCGETISACVFADELIQSGVPARPFTGESARIVTDDVFGSASVTDMDTAPLTETLAQGLVPVVTGFQGRRRDRFTTTLGRGGSDTSAVVIGGFLKADVVDIYTDVPGVALTDPRVEPGAAFLERISREDMLTLARWGSGVIHPRAVQAAMDFGVPLLRVRSTFDDCPGTIIGAEETVGLAGIAVLKDLAGAPEEGRTFVAGLPEGSAVVTVVYHGDRARLNEIAVGSPRWMTEKALHIGVSADRIATIAGGICRRLAKKRRRKTMFREMLRARQQLPREECVRILKEQPRGVLAVLGDEDYPYCMPLDHWYDEENDKLYFHGLNRGHKIDAMRRHDKASFCVYDEGYRKEGDWALNIKSVIVFGRIRFVEDRQTALEICRHICFKFMDDAEKIDRMIRTSTSPLLVFELSVEHMTGKLVNES